MTHAVTTRLRLESLTILQQCGYFSNHYRSSAQAPPNLLFKSSWMTGTPWNYDSFNAKVGELHDHLQRPVRAQLVPLQPHGRLCLRLAVRLTEAKSKTAKIPNEKDKRFVKQNSIVEPKSPK